MTSEQIEILFLIDALAPIKEPFPTRTFPQSTAAGAILLKSCSSHLCSIIDVVFVIVLYIFLYNCTRHTNHDQVIINIFIN